VNSAVLAERLRHAPDVAEALDAAWDAAWSSVDPCLLELCRLEIAMILRNPVELESRTPAAAAAGFDDHKVGALTSWMNSPMITAAERACLAFTDAFVIDVASLPDDTAAAVREHLGDAGLVDFASALLVLEQRQRLALVWSTLFAGTS
jgi:hypothetical protein